MKTDHAPAFVDFKEVKANVNIIQVLEHYRLMETFKQTGDRLSGPCPIHKGKNPTAFRVSPSKNCFNCFGRCGRGGNVIDFVALMEEVEFRDAALLLQEWFMSGASDRSPRPSRRTNPRQRPEPAPKDTEVSTSEAESNNGEDDPNVNPPLNFELKTLKHDHPYPLERGLTPETVQHFGIGHCTRGMLRGRIAIPIHNRSGELVAYSGRWPGTPSEETPKYKFPKGFRKALEIFNLHRALEEPEDTPLVIVEGFFDCFTLWQAGIPKCVALMGCCISEEQERLLAESLPPDSQIELLFDNDDAGAQGARSVAERLAQFAEVRIVGLPEAIHQPDELSEDDIADIFA